MGEPVAFVFAADVFVAAFARASDAVAEDAIAYAQRGRVSARAPPAAGDR
jgi:hypothetical protein